MLPKATLLFTAVASTLLAAGSSNADDSQFILKGSDKTDADVLKAGARTGVRAVRWNETRISDAALKVLRKWPDLYGVYLRNNSVTGTGLKYLSRHKKLVQVTIIGPKVSDKGLAALKHVKHVTHLQIGSGDQHKPQITDRVLLALAGLKHLQYLDIDGALITEEGLEELAKFKQLKSVLFLRCPLITEESVKRLRNALPKATIQSGFDWK